MDKTCLATVPCLTLRSLFFHHRVYNVVSSLVFIEQYCINLALNRSANLLTNVYW